MPSNRPVLIEIDDTSGPCPADVPPVPDLGLPDGRAVQVAASIAAARPSKLSQFAFWVFGTLFSFMISVAIWDFVTSLLARNTLLGWAAVRWRTQTPRETHDEQLFAEERVITFFLLAELKFTYRDEVTLSGRYDNGMPTTNHLRTVQ